MEAMAKEQKATCYPSETGSYETYQSLSQRSHIELQKRPNCPFPDTMSVQKWTLYFMLLLIINELPTWHGYCIVY